MRRKFGILLSLILISCASQDQYETKTLSQETVDSTYTERTVTWRGTFEGEQLTYYIKSFDSGGMLAICALRIESTGTSEVLTEEWFWNAFVAVGNASTKVARSRFVASVPAGKPRSQWWANCIETKTPAEARLLSAPVGFVGGEIVVWF
ncbi:MAG: hypothetical protein O7A03_00200 [Alphaproteobacteria bacterium]|nr:hypothetical protein [Alphaproteobacteria bacterium]